MAGDFVCMREGRVVAGPFDSIWDCPEPAHVVDGASGSIRPVTEIERILELTPEAVTQSLYRAYIDEVVKGKQSIKAHSKRTSSITETDILVDVRDAFRLLAEHDQVLIYHLLIVSRRAVENPRKGEVVSDRIMVSVSFLGSFARVEVNFRWVSTTRDYTSHILCVNENGGSKYHYYGRSDGDS